MKEVIKEYCVFPEHIKACNFTKEEYENLWWDQDEYPNRATEDSVEDEYYWFSELYDTNDPGIISGYTTEKYLLEIYDEETLEKYPLIKRLVGTNPPEYNREIHTKRHMTKEEIKEALKDIKI
jgi:hypothetical protein